MNFIIPQHLLIIFIAVGLLLLIGLLLILIFFVSSLIDSSENDTLKDSHKRIHKKHLRFEYPWERAGRIGEKVATNLIRQILNEDDVLLTNVKVSYEDHITEIDDLVINNNGVFIFEIKNYVGDLYGEADDAQWEKVKTTDAGNVYSEYVNNPLHQLTREEGILGRYLRQNGVQVWVEGYLFFVNDNTPIKHPKIVESIDDIDMAIHHSSDKRISDASVQKILNML